jgi:hypothetical protein
MTVSTWLELSTRDAERRGLPALTPLLDTLARSTMALRNADWNRDASGISPRPRQAGPRAEDTAGSPGQPDDR